MGYRLSTLVKERHELSFAKPSGIQPWPQGRGPAKSPGSKSIFNCFHSGSCVFWDTVYQRWLKERHVLSLLKPWGIHPWPQGQRPARSPSSKSIFNLCLSGTCVFWGSRLSTLVKERHELSFVKPWPQGRGPAKSPGSKSIFNFCLSGTCVFWDIVYQRW